MKLFVWHKVLCDYTCGMAFAVAENLEEALDNMRSFNGGKPSKPAHYITDELRGVKPEEYDLDHPIAFYVYGGG